MKYISIILNFLYIFFSYGNYTTPTIIRDPSKAKLVRTMETKNSYISYLKDNNNNWYILKQKRPHIKRTIAQSFGKASLCLAREVVGSQIAYDLKVPTQLVWVIPYHQSFPGKMVDDMPATLHTLVPGKTLIEGNSKYKQYSFSQSKKAPLTRALIHLMTLHPQLSAILALDTAIANYNRSSNNIMFDEVKKEFFSIDLDVAFKCDLATQLLHDLPGLLRNNFSLAEKAVLAQYTSYIQKFLQLYTPAKIEQEIKKVYKTMGIPNHPVDLSIYTAHYSSLQKVVRILETYIGKCRRAIALKSLRISRRK